MAGEFPPLFFPTQPVWYLFWVMISKRPSCADKNFALSKDRPLSCLSHEYAISADILNMLRLEIELEVHLFPLLTNHQHTLTKIAAAMFDPIQQC